jgi:Cu(I)/Ag(I) efflux system periplasmic protein CusF
LNHAKRSAQSSIKVLGKQTVKALQYLLVAGATVGLAAFAGVVYSQTPPGHDHHAAASAVKTVKAEMSEGEVRKVDMAKKTITLKHGPIKNLDMPGMTMMFQVADASLLEKVKAGDKVRFVAAKLGGKLTVTEIQPAQ